MPAMQGLQYYNQAFVVLAEHYDEFIQAHTLKNPNVWHDRIPRSAYPLFSGLEQKTNIYRGGLPVQAGLSTWKALGTSRKPSTGDPGFDNCAVGTPHTYGYAVETIQYSGYKDEYQSEPICVNDLRFVDFAKEQLALIIRTGVEYGVSIQENWNREMYVQQAMLSSRGMVMCTGSLDFEDNANHRFAYDPFAVIADEDGANVPYITIPIEAAEMSTLNWDFIDYLKFSLAGRAPEAAIANESGMPVYGLLTDLMDFERMVKADAELREDWRYVNPKALIEGYNLGMKVYRGIALMHDPRQMRFRVKGLDASGDIVATRVLPLRAGRTVTIGQVPEPNPDYYRAEIAIGVLFMNDVLQNLFVPSIDNLGSGMTFGPAPGLTGDWKWINIPSPTTNMLGETGFFYGRFEIFPKPMMFASDCTVFAYRRCAQALRTKCAIQDHDDVGTGAIAITADAASTDIDTTNRRITLTLAELLDAGLADSVSIVKADGNAFAATLISDALAPVYVFGWASGATNAPTAHTDFTAAVTTVTVA